jgi:8-oxo-dGTP pyrophosphatase MutT (NUDIX family)
MLSFGDTMRKDNGLALAIGSTLVLALAGMAKRGSSALVDEGMVGGYWGSQGAGALLTTGERCLLLLRSSDVLDPGVWGVPGGAVRVDRETGEPEDLWSAARKEVEEEAGLNIDRVGRVVDTTVFKAPRGSFRYTTFIVYVPEAWAAASRPSLNWESDEYGWFTKNEIERLPLHPGVTFTLSATNKVFHG